MNVKVVNMGSLSLPEYKTAGASGVDLMANLESTVVLKPMERFMVPTGLFVEIPEG